MDNAKLYYKIDLAEEDAIVKFVHDRADQLTAINYIHCAGVSINNYTTKLPLEDWRTTLASTLDSAFLISKHILPLMRKQNYGRIIFCSSIVPQLGVSGTAAYSAAKAGLWGLMKTIAKENAEKNITCNCINLGYFDVGMTHDIPNDLLNMIKDAIPMKRLGDPTDIHTTMNFLIKCGYITGTGININGGLY